MTRIKRIILTLVTVAFLLRFILLTVGSSSYRPIPCLWHLPIRLDVYEMAEVVTGAPSRTLRGIACAESNEQDERIGDDGISAGRFQLNEKYHRERARLYGEYNPFVPLEAARVAGGLYVDNLRQLRSQDCAISAHRWGPAGEQAHGLDCDYVSRVKANAR